MTRTFLWLHGLGWTAFCVSAYLNALPTLAPGQHGPMLAAIPRLDPGDGDGAGVGLENVRRRVPLYFRDRAKFPTRLPRWPRAAHPERQGVARAAEPVVDRFSILSAQGMKYFQLGPSV